MSKEYKQVYNHATDIFYSKSNDKNTANDYDGNT